MAGIGACIKIELIDNMQQSRTAQNLLGNALHPLLQVIVHIGRHVVFRHGGLFHQNQGARHVARRETQLAPHTIAQPRKSGIKK